MDQARAGNQIRWLEIYRWVRLMQFAEADLDPTQPRREVEREWEAYRFPTGALSWQVLDDIEQKLMKLRGRRIEVGIFSDQRPVDLEKELYDIRGKVTVGFPFHRITFGDKMVNTANYQVFFGAEQSGEADVVGPLESPTPTP